MNMATTLQTTNPFYTSPEQIEEVAKYLFKAATGYDYDTGPVRSLDTEVR
jgi:hypothetical protein